MKCHFSVEQLPADEPEYDEYEPDPCLFCGEDPCECEEEGDDE